MALSDGLVCLQVALYESARCLHGRKLPLRGNFYVNLFSHYRIKGERRWFAPSTAPTDVGTSDDNADDVDSADSIRCLRTETSRSVCIEHSPSAVDRVSFTLQNAGKTALYVLWAVPGEDHQYTTHATIPPGSGAVMSSFVGHNLFLRGVCNDLIRVHSALDGKTVIACSAADEHWLLEREYPLVRTRSISPGAA
jgi:hypothetical protein